MGQELLDEQEQILWWRLLGTATEINNKDGKSGDEIIETEFDQPAKSAPTNAVQLYAFSFDLSLLKSIPSLRETMETIPRTQVFRETSAEESRRSDPKGSLESSSSGSAAAVEDSPIHKRMRSSY